MLSYHRPSTNAEEDDLGRAFSQNRSALRTADRGRGALRGEEADLADPQYFAGGPLPGFAGADDHRDDRAAAVRAANSARADRGGRRRALGGEERERRSVRDRDSFPGP